MMRSIAGFLLAPFPAAIIQSVVVALWPKQGMGVFEHPASMFVAICLFFYILGLIFGVPLFLLMRQRSAQPLRAYGLAGVYIALTPVIGALIWVALQGQISAYIVAYNVAYFAVGGFFAGALFWLVARPDRRLAT